MKQCAVILCLFGFLSAAFGQTDDAFSLKKLDAALHQPHDLIAEIAVTGFREKTSSMSGAYRFFLSGRRKSIALVRTGKDADRGIAYLYKDGKARAYLPRAQAFFPIPVFMRIDDTPLCLEDFLFPSFSEEYTIVSSEQVKMDINQSPVTKFKLKAKNLSRQGETSARYPELGVFFDRKTGLVCQIDMFNDESYLEKIIKYSGFRAIGESFIPTRILVIDGHDPDAAVFVDFQAVIAADIPDYVFTRPYIGYLAH